MLRRPRHLSDMPGRRQPEPGATPLRAPRPGTASDRDETIRPPHVFSCGIPHAGAASTPIPRPGGRTEHHV